MTPFELPEEESSRESGHPFGPGEDGEIGPYLRYHLARAALSLPHDAHVVRMCLREVSPRAWLDALSQEEREGVLSSLADNRQPFLFPPATPSHADTLSPEEILAGLRTDEEGVAALFLKAFSGRLAFDVESGHWYTWQGHRWQRRSWEEMIGLLRKTIRRVVHDVTGPLVTLKYDEERALAFALQQAPTVTWPWNCRPDIVPMPDGTLDLSRPGLVWWRAGLPEDGYTITTRVRVDDAVVEDETWVFQVAQLCGDETSALQFQTLMGKSLIARADDEVRVAIPHVDSGRRLVDVLTRVLGPEWVAPISQEAPNARFRWRLGDGPTAGGPGVHLLIGGQQGMLRISGMLGSGDVDEREVLVWLIRGAIYSSLNWSGLM